ncbi:hypothetical protein BH11ACT5_BH11ACT5_01420 [soil metagenome]
MSLLTPRRFAAASAIVLVGVLGATGVAFAQAGNDDRVAVTPSPSATHTDDPATHDVGDDNGTDDPATHDVGDDNGTDDPATHDVGDDNGGDSGGSDDNSGHGNSQGDDDNSGSDDNSGHGSDD